MSSTPFVVQLAPGVYIDSSGEILLKPPPAAAVYEPPFKLPVDPAVVRDTLKDVRDAAKGITTNKSVLLSFHVWGVTEKNKGLLEFLKGVSEVADALSKVAAGVAVAASILKVLGIMKEGPDPLEVLVNQRFDELTAQGRAILRVLQQYDLRAIHLGMAALTGTVGGLAGRAPRLSVQEYRTEHAAAQAAYNERRLDFERTFANATWLSLLDPKKLTTWGSMYPGTLYTLPGGSLDEKRIASVPSVADPYFDHRLMVPLATLAAEQYLTCLRGLYPEFRSTYQFSPALRDNAKRLTTLAEELRKFGLARTVHTAAHFSHLYETEVVRNQVAGWPIGDLVLAPTCTRWRVGAMDLVNHDDEFFNPFLTRLQYELMVGPPTQTKYAGMDFAWKPTMAKLADDGAYGYRITNGQECADAANAQAEQDYAYILSMSGYPELVRLSALYRHEAAEPRTSETVRANAPLVMYEKQTGGPVQVKSSAFAGLTQVTATGHQETRRCYATLRIRTQSLKRSTHVKYRVLLRTLASSADYSDYYRADYDVARDADGVLKLLTATSPGLEVGSHAFVNAWRPSQESTLHEEKQVRMQADTFDVFIPVSSAFDATNGQVPSLAELHAYGKATHIKESEEPARLGSLVQTERDAGTPLSKYPWVVDPLPGLAWRTPALDDERGRRSVKRQQVELACVFDWTEDEINLTLQSEPASRSFVVHVVVEEQLQGPAENILHTALAVPMDGLVTYVPKSFFERESLALAQTAKAISEEVGVMLADFGDVKPPDPGELRVISPAILEGSLASIERKKPELHQQLLERVRSRLL